MQETQKFADKLSMLAGKVAANRYIVAIRDAFASTIPVTIAAAVFVLINNLLLNPDTGLLKGIPGREFISNICIQGYNGTLGVLGLMITFLIGYRLAKTFGSDGALEGIVGVACLVTLVPNVVNVTDTAGKNFEAAGVLTQTFTSSSTMFLGIIAALVGVRLLCALSKSKKLKISMPESVPPAIANSFNKLIPSFLVITLFAIAEGTIKAISGQSVPDLIVKFLQVPLVGGFQSLPGILFYVFIATFVFIFGIHGAYVFGAISGPILLTSLQQNLDAINAGQTAPNIVTQPFLDVYVYMGGGGTMICLVIALLIFSKRKDERTISKIGGVSSLFNISEPIMFGLPIVFNPVYAIPFCLVPIVATLLAYFATSIGLVGPAYISIPWVTPPIIGGFLATGDIRGSILQIVIIAIGVVIYSPFVLVSNRVYKRDAAREEAATSAVIAEENAAALEVAAETAE
jgi:PTS system cellobiose-specific IIC component